MSLLGSVETPDWVWFETGLAYDNARLPQALIVTGVSTGELRQVEAGLRTLRWLMKMQTAPAGFFRPVGSDTFGKHRAPPAAFDQQPLEAAAAISACLAAWRADGGVEWRAEAARAFAWFTGRNDLSLPLVDVETGSCRDGLHRDRPNENRGGEFVGFVSARPRRDATYGPHDGSTTGVVDVSGAGRMTFVVAAQAKRPAVSAATFFNRQPLYLRPDPARVVVRPFRPATEPRDLNPTDKRRADHIVDRVLAMDAETTASLLDDVLQNFEGRHRNLLARFEARAAEMEDALSGHADFSRSQRQLVGAYFMHEYSFEASALFNPSIVLHPDQTGAPAGGCRFVLSVRAVGEGHISSLTFRAGSIASDGSVTIDPTTRLASVPQVVNRVAGPVGDIVDVHFKYEDDISERVIFPITLSQANGIEDARFVAFEDEGQRIYYATYTAYSGAAIRSELIETSDFRSFRMTPLRGSAVGNKGMGPFPSQDRRPLRDDRATRQRESLPDLLGRPLLVERRHAHPQAKVSLGVRPDRKLRRSDRAWTRVGSCSRTALARFESIRSARCFSISPIRPGFSDGRQNRSFAPNRPNAKGTCPMSSTPVERCARALGSSCPTPCRTHSRPWRQSRSTRC